MELLNMIVDLALQLLAALANVIDALCDSELGDFIGANATYPGQPVDTGQPITAESLRAAGVGTVLTYLIPAIVVYMVVGGKVKLPKKGRN